MARPLVYGALATGVLVVSTAAILIRLAQQDGAHSLTIAALRLGLATVILVPLALARDRVSWRSINRNDLLLGLASGACLAVHFGTWISSLEFTSVANSTALVTTSPIWVGIASALLLRESITPTMAWGIALALAGTAIMLVADGTAPASGSSSSLGNMLALIGAVSAGAYLIIGRMLRARIPLLTYVSLAYGCAAVLLLAAATVQGAAIAAMGTVASWCIAGLALGPQLIGHTLLNWSVRQVPATLVALSILGEPIGSSLLALLLFGEVVSVPQLLGFVLILSGIFVASTRGSDAR